MRIKAVVCFAMCLPTLAVACNSPTTAAVLTPPAPAATNQRAVLRTALAEHRREALARLEVYTAAGIFPLNTSVAPAGHFFRDSEGRLCAVANLVHQDGRDDLVDATVQTKNDLVVADVHVGPLYDWILRSGLTQEELSLVQRPAPIVARKVRPLGQVAAGAAKTPPAPALSSEAEMRERVATQLVDVERQLEADEQKSLDLAADRLLARNTVSS